MGILYPRHYLNNGYLTLSPLNLYGDRKIKTVRIST